MSCPPIGEYRTQMIEFQVESRGVSVKLVGLLYTDQKFVLKIMHFRKVASATQERTCLLMCRVGPSLSFLFQV